MQSSTSSSALNKTVVNKTPATKLMTTPKTTSIKTKSSTVLNLSKPNSKEDLETNLEIEKISKKISETADALYRTWQSHGLAPTEIYELYTVDAGVAAGAITDDKSAEDLQKLVSTFVNKDKEQRGVKTSLNKSKLTSSKTEVQPKITENKINTSKLATPLISNHNNITMTPGQKQQQQLKGVNNLTDNNSATGIKKSPSTSPTKTTNFLLKNTNNLVDATDTSLLSNNNSSMSSKVTKLKTSKQGIGVVKSPLLTTSPTTSEQPSKPLEIDIDFNLNLDLNLDVHKLGQQQTENLQKIKELLKEPGNKNSVKPMQVLNTNTSKIPAALVDHSTVGGKLKEVKVKKVSVEKNKQNEEMPVQKKTSNELQSTKKLGSKLKTTDTMTPILSSNSSSTLQTIKTHDVNTKLNNQIGKVLKEEKLEEEKSKILVNNRDNNMVTVTPTTPTATTTAVVQNHKKRINSSSSSISSSSANGPSIITNGNVALLTNATESPALFEEEVVKSTTNNTSNDISPTTAVKTSKSTIKTLKTSKLKEKSNAKETPKEQNDKQNIDNPAALTSKEKITTTTTAVNKVSQPQPQQDSQPEQTKLNASDSLQQNMETQRSNTSTTMPTPTKFKSSRPLTNGQDKSLRSPFLTRGSVAERVMIFEKCPDVRNSFLNIKRPERSDAPPKSLLKVKLHATPPPPPPEQNLIQKELKSSKSVYIPRFYFPHGKPQPTIALERTLRGILSAFDTFPNNQVTKDELPRILKICGLPFYWRMPVMVFCQQHNSGLVERQRFVEFWKQMNVYCHDNASRFVYILSRGQRQRNYILPEDLAPLVQDVVDTHPGLAFLKEATEFHSRYVHTVIARIFYSVNRSWSGKISISELKKSDLLEIITLLEEEDDINQIMAFFSYEHFYVIYCKFWELDKDHDLLINQDDLARHSDHALSTRIVERIFSGCVTRSDNKKQPDDEPKMSYTDFVWFLLSEEDKRTPTAIEYWFRCMDVDGDGLLSMYELEYFYEEQQQRMESIGIESLPFEDCLCQMLDMIKPKRRDAITLGDLKNCKMTHVFFDTFFNLEKYLDHEQRDPFASQRDEYVNICGSIKNSNRTLVELPSKSSDWDRFAAQEYELLITEEN